MRSQKDWQNFFLNQSLCDIMSSMQQRQPRGCSVASSSSSSSVDHSSTATRERRREIGRLRAWMGCLVSSGLALVWLNGVFLRPLRQEAIDMHQQQLDPTEIVAIPYDLYHLLLFVMCTIFASILNDGVASRASSTSTLISWIRSVSLPRLIYQPLIMFMVMILCGASPYQDVMHTLCASYYLSIVSTSDPPHLIFSSTMNDVNPSWIDRLSLAHNMVHAQVHLQSPASSNELTRVDDGKDRPNKRLGTTMSNDASDGGDSTRLVLQSTLTHCVICMNVPIMVLRLYDRGWQWQRWPIPIIVASTYGWIFGNVVATAIVTLPPLRKWFEQTFTDNVVSATDSKASTRSRQD